VPGYAATDFDRMVRETKNDPFARHIEDEPLLKTLYLDNEKHDGYGPDRNVFGDNITAEDTMNVLVKYRTGPVLNYSLNAYLPREGFHVAFNGTKGRLEYTENHETFSEEWNYEHRCIVHPMFGQPRRIEVPKPAGGHGGGDPLLQEQMFSLAPPPEPWGRNAGHEQGAASILIGIAANHAIATGQPVAIHQLCPQLGARARLHELV
jgi:hypothetical protein